LRNTTLICASCGTNNEVGRKFCKECGSALVVVCPECTSANAPDSKFCGECGAALGTSAAPAVPLTPAARATERRLVSILFADLVGSTSLADGRDPEEVRDLLSRYFDAARETIERYGGLVEKFIGDAVMAVWGTPTAHEDDAERAVRAALELLEAVDTLGAEVGAPLRARGGVLTGEAAATVGAVAQGIVAGDLVNTASRLQSMAEPGSVLVGEATVRATGRAIGFEPVGELTLKGKDVPLPAWRALRVLGERGGAGRGEAIEAPFVGRSEELRMIKELVRSTGAEGKARLISVSGIGGIGKSRLGWELLKWIDGLVENIWWHQGRCPSYGDGVTFWALGEMVRMRARIAETDDAATSRRKLSASVAEFIADPEERRWIEPRLAHLLGLDAAPPGDREELFSAWRTFFERIAERGTTVMVFEDLQWADPGLLDFIESMLEWSKSYPILIITLARPELTDRRPGWGSGQRSFTALHLEPLPDPVIAELVEGFVRGIPSESVERIVARAEGVPLYAVETVRMLADRGVLETRDDAYELVGEVGELEIPETLHALIAARLDALAPEQRALLQDASVVGMSFTIEGLAAVAGEEPDQVERRLRELVRKEFLELELDARSPERGQYTFLQALIKEVAYSTLSRADRRSRHLATAHHLEGLGDEELASVVATHYVEAFRASPEGPEADALAARARDWLSQAAQRALSLGSSEQALGYAELALDVTPKGAERASLLETGGKAAAMAAQFARAEPMFDEAIALYSELGDTASAGRATAGLYEVLGPLDRRAEAAERMERALEALGQHGDEHATAELCAQIAQAHVLTGSPELALGWAERALAIAERLHLNEVMLMGLDAKHQALFNLGRHREATMLAHGGLALADEVGSIRHRAWTLMSIGVYSNEDDPAGALRAMLECADVARRAGDRVTEMIALPNAAENSTELGRWAEADEVLRKLEGRELSPMARDAIAFCEVVLEAHRGDPGAAAGRLAEMAPSLEEAELIPLRTWFRRVRSLVSLLSGKPEEAFDEAMGAVDLDPSGMNTPLAVREAARAAIWSRDPEKVRRVLDAMTAIRGRWIDTVRRTAEAGLAALEGRREDAVAGYERALEAWRSLESRLDLAFCAVDMAHVLADEDVTHEAVTEARSILTDIGGVRSSSVSTRRPRHRHAHRLRHRRPHPRHRPEPTTRTVLRDVAVARLSRASPAGPGLTRRRSPRAGPCLVPGACPSPGSRGSWQWPGSRPGARRSRRSTVPRPPGRGPPVPDRSGPRGRRRSLAPSRVWRTPRSAAWSRLARAARRRPPPPARPAPVPQAPCP
jgi:class 3 adenylate cyclase/tetratricopeptide (TPR) repeat protein